MSWKKKKAKELQIEELGKNLNKLKNEVVRLTERLPPYYITQENTAAENTRQNVAENIKIQKNTNLVISYMNTDVINVIIPMIKSIFPKTDVSDAMAIERSKNLPPTAELELRDLPKSGGAMAPQGTTGLHVETDQNSSTSSGFATGFQVGKCDANSLSLNSDDAIDDMIEEWSENQVLVVQGENNETDVSNENTNHVPQTSIGEGIVASNHVNSGAATGTEVISTDTHLQNSDASSVTSNDHPVVQDGDNVPLQDSIRVTDQIEASLDESDGNSYTNDTLNTTNSTTEGSEFAAYDREERKEVKLNNALSDSLMMICPSFPYDSWRLRAAIFDKIKAVIGYWNTNTLFGKVKKFSLCRKRSSSNLFHIFIEPHQGTLQSLTELLRYHQNQLTEYCLVFRSNLGQITRLKKKIIGKISKKLQEDIGPKAACIQRFTQQANLFVQQSEETEIKKINYKEVINTYGNFLTTGFIKEIYKDIKFMHGRKLKNAEKRKMLEVNLLLTYPYNQ